MYEHIRYLDEHIHQPNLTKTFMKSEPQPRASPLFGMLLVENIESYFGSTYFPYLSIDVVDYQNMGPKLFLFIKLLKKLDNLMPFNSNLCFTYNYNSNVCRYEDLLAFVKSDGLTCWRVSSDRLEKNGFHYESEWSRKFYKIYELEDGQQ